MTVASTEPDPAGTTAVIRESEITVNATAAVPSKVTAVAPVNPVPVKSTVLPPVSGPEPGATEARVGAGM
nr:hypothetical protein [Nocardia asiatica]